MQQVVLIPTLNPSDTLPRLVRELAEEGFAQVLVVDDGSDASCAPVFAELEARGCTVVHHPENCGKGAAIKTGIEHVMQGAEPHACLITADGDGQHLASDIARVAREASAHEDSLVLGVRDFSGSSVPARSRFGNAVSSAYYRLLTGKKLGDTQTGLRAIPPVLFPLALETPGERYEWEMNFLLAVAREAEPVQVPIETVYLANNAESHFNPIVDSARVFAPVLRFTASSVCSAGVDLGLFALLERMLPFGQDQRILVATIAARVVSAIVNFAINRQWSFQAQDGAVGSQAVRYTVLAIAKMLASAWLVSLASGLPLPLPVTKACADVLLFVVGYAVQNAWVFARKTTGAGGKRLEP